MSADPGGPPVRLHADPLDLAVEVPLSVDEAGYVEAARAPNTLRGYRSDWAEFTAWCARLGGSRCRRPRIPSRRIRPSWPWAGRRWAP